MINLARLEEITDLRSVWKNEATDFTPWLAEDNNIKILADAVGIDIAVEEIESGVGGFSVDIYATETGTERKIIIENQLEDTNHDHLGKLITYAAGKSADIIIWVVKHAREEHRAAIEWLNNHTDDTIGFFLCEIKLYKIENSKTAVTFEVVEQPNDWAKGLRMNGVSSATLQHRYEYWRAFQDYAFNNAAFSKAFNRRKESMNHWLSYSMGSSEYHISVVQVIRRDELGVEFYINDDKAIFKKLYANKAQIEADTGIVFDWQELPQRKASRIIVTRQVALYDENQWQAQFDWIINAMLKIKGVFPKYLP